MRVFYIGTNSHLTVETEILKIIEAFIKGLMDRLAAGPIGRREADPADWGAQLGEGRAQEIPLHAAFSIGLADARLATARRATAHSGYN